MISIIRSLTFNLLGFINTLIFRYNKISGPRPKIRGLLLLKNNGGSIQFGEECILNSSKYKNIIGGDTRSSIIVKAGASLVVGKNFRMSNSAIYCAKSIVIGDNVMVGGSCKIWDTDFHPLSQVGRLNNPNEGYKTRPITIGNSVFIGGFSIILKGTTIGDGAIIGAGSVVSGNIPSKEIWAGNPAKFLKSIDA